MPQNVHPTQSFIVDDVTPNVDRIWSQPLSENLRWRLGRKVFSASDPERPVVNAIADDFLKRLAKLIGEPASSEHSLIHAVSTAFNQHRPLILTPDSIWLVIAQGFSHHITENAETLRGRLVRHSGKQTLRTDVRDLSHDSLRRSVDNFSSYIRDRCDPVLHDALVCDFSTTDAAIRTASQIVLLDSYRGYFSYGLRCICGIPSVTLTGTPRDWQRMQERFEVLATYDLEWWGARVRPILNELVKSAEGYPNREFWKAIYNPRQTYGATTVTGWIADLFPYLGDPPRRRRNNVFAYQRRNWLITDVEKQTTPERLDPEAKKGASGFPSGFSRVCLTVDLPGGSQTAIDLLGGFLGIEQGNANGAIMPVLGWCGAELNPEQ